MMKSKLRKTWKVGFDKYLQVKQDFVMDLCSYLNKWLLAGLCVCLPLVGIKELEKEKLSLQSDSESYSNQVTELFSGPMQHSVILSLHFHLLLDFTLLHIHYL